MKPIYFVRPIWQMFDFKGATGRAEYFTYAVTSFLLTLILTVATHLFSTVNWTMIVSSEMLDENGRLLWVPPAIDMQNVFWFLWSAFQLPMIALTVRRLRDQNASYWVLGWLVFPLLDPAVLFGCGFVPTFRDYEVTLADGTRVMRSQQLSERRFRNTLITAAALVGGTAVLAGAMSDSVFGMRLEGGKKVPTNRTTGAGRCCRLQPATVTEAWWVKNRCPLLGHRSSGGKVPLVGSGHGRTADGSDRDC